MTIDDDISVPEAPPKSPGPHFAFVEGQVAVVHQPTSGLNLPRLNKMVPLLREAAAAAASTFAGTNTFPSLTDNLGKYRALLEGDIAELDYELIAARCTMLANAEAAASRNIRDRMLGEMEDHAKAALANLIDLNSIVVLSTDAGSQVLSDAAGYRHTPEDEQEFRRIAGEIAEAVEKSNLATEEAASLLSESAKDIGEGPNPERSGVIATRVVGGIGLTLVGAAAVVAAPALVAGALSWATILILGEGIKRSEPGQAAANTVRDLVDDPRKLADLNRIGQLTASLETKFRTLAGKRREFKWMSNWFDWLRGPGKSEATRPLAVPTTVMLAVARYAQETANLPRDAATFLINLPKGGLQSKSLLREDPGKHTHLTAVFHQQDGEVLAARTVVTQVEFLLTRYAVVPSFIANYPDANSAKIADLELGEAGFYAAGQYLVAVDIDIGFVDQSIDRFEVTSSMTIDLPVFQHALFRVDGLVPLFDDRELTQRSTHLGTHLRGLLASVGDKDWLLPTLPDISYERGDTVVPMWDHHGPLERRCWYLQPDGAPRSVMVETPLFVGMVARQLEAGT